ncbi:hypothetical protein C8N36_102405 [Pelagimonas varians]|uniref:Uncharacterized protein n=1 Tax=Pelagimonas varians TaxID=696760 RepID=A0A238K3D2_9RHOB|nr:hypothetical protein C8N36_102405 [Pelagimonas varians]SMX36612.1 hypothetical protein PEV8663_00866 [Pelagimonas varians]
MPLVIPLGDPSKASGFGASFNHIEFNLPRLI